MNKRKACIATTKAGTPCRNSSRPGSTYCHIHETANNSERAKLKALVTELNELATDLQKLSPAYSPPPFSRQGLLDLLKKNGQRLKPEIQGGLLGDLQTSLEGASPKDLLDPETWKGLWFVLNYSLQNESAGMREKLAALPGASLFNDMRGMLSGARPGDLLEIDTWKGMWFLLNYSAQNQIEGLKQRLTGSEG